MLEQTFTYEIDIQGAIKKHIHSTTAAVEFDLPPGHYDCRVAAQIGDVQGDWSESAVVETRLGSPRILGPEQIEAGSQYSVEWTEIPFATKYRLYEYGLIRENQELPLRRLNERVSETTNRSLVASVFPGDYGFTVVAYSETSDGTIQSQESALHIVHSVDALQPPTLEIPEEIYAGESFEVTWNSISKASGYELEWSLNGDSTAEDFLDVKQMITTHTGATLRFEQVGLARYRIRALTEQSHSAWGTIVERGIRLSSPNNVSTIISGSGTLIRWDHVIGADSYRIRWADGGDIDTEHAMLAHTLEQSALVPHPGQFARIKALSKISDIESSWSPIIALPSFETSLLLAKFSQPVYECHTGEPLLVGWNLLPVGIEIHNPRFEVHVSPSNDFHDFRVA